MSLDGICSLETYREILESLTPEQLAVVALRLDGLGVTEIGLALDINKKAVVKRLAGAQKRAKLHLNGYDLTGRRRAKKVPMTISGTHLRILAAVDHLTAVGIPASASLVGEYLDSSVWSTMERMVDSGLLVKAEKVGRHQTYAIAPGIVKENA